MKQKQFYFIYVFLLSMSFLGACSKDSPNELIPNTIVKIEIDELPGKRIYFIGEELDVSDMTLKVFYSNETSEIVPVKKDEVTGFNSTVPENDQMLDGECSVRAVCSDPAFCGASQQENRQQGASELLSALLHL